MNASRFSPLMFVLGSLPVFAQDLPTFVNSELPGLVDTYKGLHAHPELSHHEEQPPPSSPRSCAKPATPSPNTSANIPTAAQAYGVVAILKNGAGPRC